MDKKKQIDLIKKRNTELSKQLKDIKFKSEFNSQLNMEGYKKAKLLIVELENIKSEWLSIIDDLKKKQVEYDYLIFKLRETEKIMKTMGFNAPWYKKFLFKIIKK